MNLVQVYLRSPSPGNLIPVQLGVRWPEYSFRVVSNTANDPGMTIIARTKGKSRDCKL